MQRLFEPSGIDGRAAARRGRAAARGRHDVRRQRAAQGRAAAAATGRPAIADDSGIEAAALGGRARRALGPLRRGGRHRRGEPREARRARCRPDSRAALRVRAGLRRTRRPARSACSSATAAAAWPRERRGIERLRLRPRVRSRRDRGQSHHGRAHGRREGRDQPSRPRGAGAAEMAPSLNTDGRTGGPADQSANGRPVGRLQLRPDPAQGGGRIDHRLGGDPDRGGALEHRPGGLDGRLLLGAQGRRAGRREPPLRAREAREPGGGDRGDADPGRVGRDRLRGDPPPGSAREQVQRLGIGIAVVGVLAGGQPGRVDA